MTILTFRGRPRGARVLLSAGLAAAALGAAAMTVVPAIIVITGVVAVAACVAILHDPEWGLAAVAAFTVLRLPDVATDFHGAPSLFTPLLAFVLLALLVRSRATGERPVGGLRALALFGGFVMVALGSLTVAADTGAGTHQVILLVKDGMVAILVGMLLRRSSALRLVIWVLVVGGAALATLSILQFLTGSFNTTFGGFAQSAVQNIYAQTDDVRISGPIGDPNFYAQLLVMLVPLAYDRMRDETSRFLRVAAAYAGLACAVGVILTFSRGGALALAVVAVALIVRHPPKVRTVVAVGVLALAALPFLPPGYLARLGALGQVGEIQAGVDPSIRGRTAELTAAWEMFADHPLVGVGYGNYIVLYPEYARESGIDIRSTERNAHNLYLATAAETGIAGLVALGAVIVGAFVALHSGRKRFREMSDHRADGIGYAIAVSLVGYLITSLFLHMAFARFAWLMIGLALAFPSTAAAEDRARDAAAAGASTWR
ncbi:MAG: O-antigen ligase family protein [Actinomycetota bacterium]